MTAAAARAWQLPPEIPIAEAARSFGGVALSTAVGDDETARRVLTSLRSAAAREIARAPRVRARIVAAAARRFLDRADPLRRTAEELLPPLTGLSTPVVRDSLVRVFGPLDADSLAAIVASAGRPFGLVGVVGAGNVPGVPVAKTALALTAGSACLVKTASGEPLLAVLFARAIREEDEALGAAVAALWWAGEEPGGSPWRRALGEVDSVVAYGSDAAIETLRRGAATSFIGHGHRVSGALVCLRDGASVGPSAAAAASDVAAFDQRGCLSPQCIWVIGRAIDDFAAALAASLERTEAELPRGAIPEPASLAIRRLRDELEWREIAGERVRLLASGGTTAWTVLVESSARFRGSPLHRTVFVLPLGRVADLPGTLGPARGRVECLGVAPADATNDPEIRAAAEAAGIPNVVPLGTMQRPGLGWRQGGRHPMAGLAGDTAPNALGAAP